MDLLGHSDPDAPNQLIQIARSGTGQALDIHP
jgi:hypothetical protein